VQWSVPVGNRVAPEKLTQCKRPLDRPQGAQGRVASGHPPLGSLLPYPSSLWVAHPGGTATLSSFVGIFSGIGYAARFVSIFAGSSPALHYTFRVPCCVRAAYSVQRGYSGLLSPQIPAATPRPVSSQYFSTNLTVEDPGRTEFYPSPWKRSLQFQLPMSTLKLGCRSVMFGAITAVMLAEYSEVRDWIVILTEWPSVTKLESPISVTDAEDFIFFNWSWFANWDVIRCSWEPESSRARQGTKTPERFFTKTLAVAKSTISLLNSCAIRQCRGNLCSFLWRKGRWVSQVKQSVVLRSACTTTTGVALPNLMTNLKTISQETGF